MRGRPIEVEAEEGELPTTPWFPAIGFYQSALLFRQTKVELREAFGEGFKIQFSFVFLFKSDDEVIGITHEDHFSLARFTDMPFDPEIEDIVQVNVGEDR